MKKVIVVLLVLAVALPASAGPIARDAVQTAKEVGQAAPQANVRNRYLYPSLALIGGGAAVALVGFLHTTRHAGAPSAVDGQILTANPFLSEQLLLAAGYETRNTTLGIVGVGVAGVGGVLLAVGQKHRNPGGPKLSVGPGAVTATWSMGF